MKRLRYLLLGFGAAVLLAACGGAGGTHTLGGTVSGLRGTLVLENGSSAVTVTENGPFAFPKKLPDGSYYRVRVKTPPRFERCSVTNGEGVVNGTDVSDVAVACTDKDWMGPMELEPTLAGGASRVRAAFAGDVPMVAWGEGSSVYLSTLTFGGWSLPAQISGSGSYPALAGNLEGRAVLAWVEHGSPRRLFALSWYRGAWSPKEVVSTVGNTVRGEPQLALSTSDRAALAWIEDDGANDRATVALYDGHHWTSPHYVSPSGVDAGDPAVAVNNSGDVLAAWKQGSRVYAALRTGGVWGAPSELYTGGLNTSTPQAFLDDAGRAYVAWDIQPPGPGNPEIALASYSPQSRMWTSHLGFEYGWRPVLTGDAASGRLAFFWLKDGALWVRVYEDDDWQDSEALSPAGSNPGPASAAMDASGNVVVTWQQEDGDGVRQAYAAFRQYGDWIKPAGRDDFLSFAGRDVRSPGLFGNPAAALGEGRALVAWSQDDGSGSDHSSANLYW